MSKTKRNVFKVRFEQTDEELSDAVTTKFKLLGEEAANRIKLHWRIKGHDKQFDMTRDELIYIIRWIEDMDIEKFMELLLEDFVRFNTEFFKTAGWLQTIHEGIEPSHQNRIPSQYHVDRTLDGHQRGRVIFDDPREASEFREYKKKKDILRDAFEESEVGRG